MTSRNSRSLRRCQLTTAIAATFLFSGMAFAQDNTSSTEEKQTESSSQGSQNLDKIEVVGSRIKRAEVEGAAPVTVITREDIDREGFQTVGDMLQTLTQTTTNSFTGELAVTGFTPNAQVVNLRNLGPGYTLILIDGRRPAEYPQPYNRDNSSVNVGAIPSSIIERVEVLSGGASAIYGSDAVAGVVNIVLRKNYEGNLLRATAGTFTEGGGDSIDLELSGGRTGDDWNLVYALQYVNNEPIFASQRDFLDDLRDGPNGANVAPTLSLIAIRLSNPNANRAAYFPGADVCDRFGYSTFNSATRGLICGSYTTVGARSISNKRENISGYFRGEKSLGDNLQVWGSLTAYDSEASASSGTEFWGTSGDPFNTLRPAPGQTRGAATSAYFDPQFNSLIQLQRILNPFELGGPEAVTTNFDEQTYEVAAGLRGTFGGRFDWDATASYAHYEYEQNRPRLLAQAVHDYFLGPLLGFNGNFPIYRLNLDRWHTPFTPAQYAAVSTRVINRGETESTQANFVVTGDLFELPAGPVGFAGSAEVANQKLDLISDPRTDALRPIDSQTIYNLRSSGETHGDRSRYALGVEFSVPVFSSLTMNLASRYDKYDDITQVDDAITYSAGLEWRPIESLLIRGNYGTSFRAPDMQLVFAEGAAGFLGALDQYACRAGIGPGAALGPRTIAQCNVSGDPTIYSMQNSVSGNPALKEEEGKSWTAGFVWDIMENLSITADYYDIELEDQASVLTLAYILRNEAGCRLGTNADGTPFAFAPDSGFCQQITSFVTRQVAPGTALDGRVANVATAAINTALSHNTGVDATLRYQLDTDRMGTFDMALAYSVNLGEEFKQFDEDELVDFRDDLSNDNQRSRVRGSVAWEYGDWTTALSGFRFGSAPNAAETGRLRPYMFYNLGVQKKFGESVTAALQINNILNNTIREDRTNTGYPFFNPFIGADPAGRSVFVRVEYKF
jgi:iron complex outermembrane recepter protein